MKKTVRDIDVKGKRVLVRCDFNVPMQDGKITDDTRIVSALPTIRYLTEHGAKVILMSHMGRPKGEPKKEFTLQPVADRLTKLLGKQVVFAASDRVVDEKTRQAAAALADADYVIGSGRMLDLARGKKPILDEYRSAVIAHYIDTHRAYERFAVLLSGDTGFYSGAKKLYERLAMLGESVELHVIPGVSSVSALAARLSRFCRYKSRSTSSKMLSYLSSRA